MSTKTLSTKLIGIKDFRQNISSYVEKAQKGKERFIVMNRNSPLFEIKPFKNDATTNSLLKDILEAEEDIKNSRVYSQKEILAEFA